MACAGRACGEKLSSQEEDTDDEGRTEDGEEEDHTTQFISWLLDHEGIQPGTSKQVPSIKKELPEDSPESHVETKKTLPRKRKIEDSIQRLKQNLAMKSKNLTKYANSSDLIDSLSSRKSTNFSIHSKGLKSVNVKQDDETSPSDTDDESDDGMQDKADQINKPHTCHACGLSFACPDNLRRHMVVHTGGKPFKCTKCPAEFVHPKYLSAHDREEHRTGDFKCRFCDKTYEDQELLDAHLKKHRSVYKCPACSDHFRTAEDLKQHVNSHEGEKPLTCKYCDKTFTCEQNLQMHLNVHTGEKPYTCYFCKRKFAYPSSRRTHMITDHNCRVDKRGQVIKIDQEERESACKCEACGKTFRSKQNLRVHLRIHTGEKPFKCSQCSMSFTYPSTYKAHLERHKTEPDPNDKTDLRNLTCMYCEKKMSTKQNLRVHLRLHTGEKPFSCDLCGKKFTYWRGYKLHKEKPCQSQ